MSFYDNNYFPDFKKLHGESRSLELDKIIKETEEAYGIKLENPQELEIACVVKLDRSYPLLMSKEGLLRAEHAISLVKQLDLRAQIGDWVLIRVPKSHDKGLIEAIVPRVNELGRWSGGARGEKQVIAANVGLVLIVVALSKKNLSEASLLRVMKSLIIAHEAHCDAAILLTKIDRKEHTSDLHDDYLKVQRALGNKIQIICTSSLKNQGLDDVRSLLSLYTSAVLLGESGAGKTSLLNALVKQDIFNTQEVREKDDHGRHTTVARQMVSIPQSGIIIDAPGLRSISLTYHQQGLQDTFPEIYSAAKNCKFSDCTHDEEPECAVKALVHAGELDELRLKIYQVLETQMIHNEEKIDHAYKTRW